MRRRRMNLFVVVLLSVLIVLAAGNAILVWRAAQHAQDDADRQQCIERVEATALVALLAPASSVDAAGRLQAVKALGAKLDGC